MLGCMEGQGLLSPGSGGPSLAEVWGKLQLSLLQQEGSQSHGHQENICRAASGGWCCALWASPQPSSEPATNHHGFLLLELAPGAVPFAWKLGSALGTRGPFEPAARLCAPLGTRQSEGPAARPLPRAALLCCVFCCGKSRVWVQHVPFSSLQHFYVCS